MKKTVELVETLVADPEFVRLSRASIRVVRRLTVAVHHVLDSLQEFFAAVKRTPADGRGPESEQVAVSSEKTGWNPARAAYFSNAAKHATSMVARNGNALLESIDSIGGVDGLVETGSNLLRDKTSQLRLLHRLKTNLISFLLHYLPTVEVPIVTGQKNNVEYRLEGACPTALPALFEVTSNACFQHHLRRNHHDQDRAQARARRFAIAQWARTCSPRSPCDVRDPRIQVGVQAVVVPVFEQRWGRRLLL